MTVLSHKTDFDACSIAACSGYRESSTQIGKDVGKMRIFLLIAALAVPCCAQSAAPAATANPAYQAIVKDAQAHVKRVDIANFRALRTAHPDYRFIDVRESEEWAKGHAAGAIHISKGLIEKEIEGKVAAKDATIVVYCHSGARSALAAENLMRMGYTNVYSLDGGLAAYESAGLPVEK
jgi:rhodanese-related sulfurtransferase